MLKKDKKNNGTETYAIIFARGGSKGVKKKNIKDFCGKPLIAYSIISAIENEHVDDVFVSTDDEDIARISEKYGAKIPFIRPKSLAEDNSPEWLAWQHALKHFQERKSLPNYMISLPATSPLRIDGDITRAYKKIVKNDFDAVIAVTKSKRHPMFNMVTKDQFDQVDLLMESSLKITRRQDTSAAYDITTLVYVARTEYVMNSKGLFDGKIGAIEIPEMRAIDIDTEFDFQLATLIKENSKK